VTMAPMDSVLGRAVLLLEAFTADDHELPLAELVRRTGLPKSTAHRLLGELVDLRLLERTPHGYRLGGRLFELGMRASVERGLMEVAIPYMEDLYERTHETVHLGVREGTEVVYVAKIGGHRQAVAPSRIGGRMPLSCTAIGKALLAFAPTEVTDEVVLAGLERRTPRTIVAPGVLRRQLGAVRERGVSYEHEESTVGISCVAAPVLDPDEQVIAAISVTGPVTRFRPESAAPAVRAAAAGIAATWARRPTQRDADLPR
jgi:DNA-binding IclR family transcriptional regulator